MVSRSVGLFDGDVALKRREHTSRTLRFGFWWSARLVKGAARAWVCLRLGAAVIGSARRQAAWGGAGVHSGERLVCVHWFPRRVRCYAGSQDACAGWERAGHGWRRGLGAWEGFAERGGCHSCDTVTELPYLGRRAPRRSQAVRAVFSKVRRGAAVSGSARHRTAALGNVYLPLSNRHRPTDPRRSS